VVGRVTGLTRQREVDGEPTTQLAGRGGASDEEQQPERADDATVMHDEPSQTLHRSLLRVGDLV